MEDVWPSLLDFPISSCGRGNTKTNGGINHESVIVKVSDCSRPLGSMERNGAVSFRDIPCTLFQNCVDFLNFHCPWIIAGAKLVPQQHAKFHYTQVKNVKSDK